MLSACKSLNPFNLTGFWLCHITNCSKHGIKVLHAFIKIIGQSHNIFLGNFKFLPSKTLPKSIQLYPTMVYSSCLKKAFDDFFTMKNARQCLLSIGRHSVFNALQSISLDKPSTPITMPDISRDQGFIILPDPGLAIATDKGLEMVQQILYLIQNRY